MVVQTITEWLERNKRWEPAEWRAFRPLHKHPHDNIKKQEETEETGRNWGLSAHIERDKVKPVETIQVRERSEEWRGGGPVKINLHFFLVHHSEESSQTSRADLVLSFLHVWKSRVSATFCEGKSPTHLQGPKLHLNFKTFKKEGHLCFVDYVVFFPGTNDRRPKKQDTWKCGSKRGEVVYLM